MPNLSNTQNPLDYPRYVRGIRPALAESLPTYVEDELEKIQNSVENLAFAADENTKAKVEVEKIEREDADETLASLITTVSSEFDSALGGVNAAITSEITARTSADTALASDISDLSATVGDNTAAISAEVIARTDADTAIASSVTSLSTTVGGHTSTISSHTTSIGGLEAKYGVTLDVNGYITGFEQNNSGTSGDFIVKADRFRVVQPGSSAIVPFEVAGGIVYIKSAVIQDLSIGNAKLGDTSVSTGKIVSNAVTDTPQIYTSAETATIAYNDAGVYDIQTLSFTATGDPVLILAGAQCVSKGGGTGSFAALSYRVLRNGTVLDGVFQSVDNGSGYGTTPATVQIVDNPPPGPVTYKLQHYQANVSMYANATSKNRYINGVQLKR